MLFELSEERRDLAAAVAGVLDTHGGAGVVRAAWERPAEVVEELWTPMAALGLGGIAVAERHGGGGGDAVDLVVVLETVGRYAAPVPMLETAAVLGGLLDRHAERPLAQRWLPGLVHGSVRAALQATDGGLVAYAASAQVLVAVRGDEVHLVPREDLTLLPRTGVDHSRGLASVTVPTGADSLLSDDPATAAWVRRRVALGRAALLVGLCDRLVAMSAGYARDREQFGRAIGSFQGIKHPLADASAAIEATRSVLWRSALAEAGDESVVEELHDVLIGLAASTAARVEQLALQVHGGIGFTWEADVHLWVKRVLALQPSAAEVHAARARVARRLTRLEGGA